MTVKGLLIKYRWFKVNYIYKGAAHFFDEKVKTLRKLGVEIGDNVKIVGPIHCTGKLVIGDNCWIGADFFVYGNGEVVIGDNCDVGPNVTFLTGTHEIGDAERRAGTGRNCCQRIGSGTWIGGKSTFINDCDVGKSVVIGACSLINKDIPDSVLVVGTPARIVRKL